jgi:medium-chain acyl-[acyl-carrier-protein] hydrolase
MEQLPSALMLHPKHFYEEYFTIHTNEIDNRKVMTIPALMNLLHETAMQNVIRLKVSVWDLESENISWVLMRMLLRMKKMPRLGDQIRIVTYPAGFEKFFTYRDYRIFNIEGEEIGQVATTWLLMDTSTRKMRRIPSFITDYPMPDPETCLPRIRHKLPKYEETELQKEFCVGWYDLDFNKHLNNVLYFKWMLEATPDALLKKGQIEEIDILFRQECRWNEKLHSQSYTLDTTHRMHRLLKGDEAKEVAMAKVKWKILPGE